MCAKSNDELIHPYFRKKKNFHHCLRSTCVQRKRRRRKKIIYKSRFSWMNFARIQKNEENKCLLGMSKSTVDREEKEREREILVCDSHPQHV
jgi:hypothetical protein